MVFKNSKIRHPNVVLFLGVCITNTDLYLVSEYLPKGNLENLLHDSKIDISLFRRLRMAKDAALGMNWLHRSTPQFIHRDLKTSNLLVDENDVVKVCDFGLSQIRNQGEILKDRENAKGTPLWMAPEVMKFQEFDEKCDVYSFGIVLWEIVTRKPPFEHHRHFETFKHAICVQHERPIIPHDLEPSLSALIAECWDPVPSRRPSFEEITNRFDKILIDVAIPDDFGRVFWNKFFPQKDEVSFDRDFLPAFLHFIGTHDVTIETLNQPSLEPYIVSLKCLRALIVEKARNRTEGGQEMVSLERFGKILSYFGPIDDPRTGNGYFILERMRLMMINPWFHGDITTQEAQEKLSGKTGNTFLIRFSSIDGMYTLSTITSSRMIQHQRIKRANYGYSAEGHFFDSLEQFILSKGLTEPCAGSKYQHIFQENPPQECGYITRDY